MINANANKMVVYPMGTDLSAFKIGIPKPEAQKFFGIENNQHKLAGIIARIDPHKGQEFVINQWARIVEKHQIKLLIVGSETVNSTKNHVQHLHNLVTDLDLNNWIIFHPHISDNNTFYKAIDYLIMPSFAETYGAVTVESMANGLPIIATNSGGTPTLLQQGENGYLYQPEDANSFNQQFDEMVTNKQQTELKSKNAFAFANAELSAEKTAENLMKCFD